MGGKIPEDINIKNYDDNDKPSNLYKRDNLKEAATEEKIELSRRGKLNTEQAIIGPRSARESQSIKQSRKLNFKDMP